MLSHFVITLVVLCHKLEMDDRGQVNPIISSSTALYRSWMVYRHRHILAKQIEYFKALGRHTSIFSSELLSERTCGNKRRKNAWLQLT